jgi:eukaryotic-like serine/threonine-protein kinase
LRARLYRDVVPPRTLVAATPGWLQEIILHCLEIDARDRYASAAEFAFDLANPTQVAITERGLRDRAAGLGVRIGRWMRARKFEPAPCPPPSEPVGPAPIVMVAIASAQPDETMFEALRDAARRLIAADDRWRVACVTAVPPAAALTGESEQHTATGRHIKYLVNLRRWAKPLELPEERITYHVLESERPATALIDYARMNDVDQILIGAPHGGSSARLFRGVSAQVVAEAPCSVTVVRARSEA